MINAKGDINLRGCGKAWSLEKVYLRDGEYMKWRGKEI